MLHAIGGTRHGRPAVTVEVDNSGREQSENTPPDLKPLPPAKAPTSRRRGRTQG